VYFGATPHQRIRVCTAQSKGLAPGRCPHDRACRGGVGYVRPDVYHVIGDADELAATVRKQMPHTALSPGSVASRRP
jgi:hypothetical protein